MQKIVLYRANFRNWIWNIPFGFKQILAENINIGTIVRTTRLICKG